MLSAVILLVLWYGLDRVTFRFLPNPVRAFNRWLRQGRLKRELTVNPHDRRARLELAELYQERRRYQAAVEVLKPNVDAGDEDPVTLYTLGVACLGAGYTQQGEAVLEAVREADPAFRQGVVDLELGRWRLRRGDAKGARQALERFIQVRAGTVEGRVLLSRAMELDKDDAGAALMREAAWKEYVAAPRFQRNMSRAWAWRAKPSRPVLYAAIILAAGLLFARYVAPSLSQAGDPPEHAGEPYE